MSTSSIKKKKILWTDEKYKTKGILLKENKILSKNFDFRKKLTRYQRQKIRQQYKKYKAAIDPKKDFKGNLKHWQKRIIKSQLARKIFKVNAYVVNKNHVWIPLDGMTNATYTTHKTKSPYINILRVGTNKYSNEKLWLNLEDFMLYLEELVEREEKGEIKLNNLGIVENLTVRINEHRSFSTLRAISYAALLNYLTKWTPKDDPTNEILRNELINSMTIVTIIM